MWYPGNQPEPGAFMSLRKKFERKVREKEQEIHELERQIMDAKAYLSAMQDAIRLLPAEGPGENGEAGTDLTLKAGSTMDAVAKVLKAHGKPMHIMDLLKAIGRDPTSEHRASVGGSLAAYVRKGVVFSRPAPNTFGLAEWGQDVTVDDGPPEDFGLRPADNA